METLLYGKHDVADAFGPDARANGRGETSEVQSHANLTPALFYPVVSEREAEMWRHWLPTTFFYLDSQPSFQQDVIGRLQQLQAPSEVIEEFQWASTLDLFEAYEIRTPERRDLRDPLLVGRHGQRCYRLALWGESLRPLEEVSALVEQSLALRARVAKWRTVVISTGALLGAGLGLWLGSQSPTPGNLVEMSLFPAIMVGLMSWLPYLAYSPVRQQQDFLDRYRC
jgi:hypothetical protein